MFGEAWVNSGLAADDLVNLQIIPNPEKKGRSPSRGQLSAVVPRQLLVPNRSTALPSANNAPNTSTDDREKKMP